MLSSPQALLGRRALLDPVALLVPVVLEENQGVLVLLDSLVLLAVLARREFALQEEKEKTVSLEHKEQKVKRHINHKPPLINALEH